MAEEPDVIRHQIDQTRESLTEKLETLEGQVKSAVGTVTDTIQTVRTTVEDTVESLKSGVSDTVETVKSSVSDTVDSVKETFDVSGQVERNPWAALGVSFAAGVAAGYLTGGVRGLGRATGSGIRGIEEVVPGYQQFRPTEPAGQSVRGTPQQPSLVSSLLEPFAGEIEKVKRTAIGALIGIGRDFLKDALPGSLSGNVSEIMDNMARHMGGEPVPGPVLGETEPAGRVADGARRFDTY